MKLCMVIISMKLYSLPVQMAGLMMLASFRNSGSVCFSALSANGQNIQSSCENLKLVCCELKIRLFLGCAYNASIVSFVDRISFGMCGRFTAAEIMAFCLSFMIVCVWILTGHWLLMDGKLMHTDTAAHVCACCSSLAMHVWCMSYTSIDKSLRINFQRQ